MDFYIILGVERGATLADVKRAYKRLARKFHPDINPGDRMAAAQFRQIAEAYETLSDARAPAALRHHRRARRADSGPAFGFDGFDFTISVHGNEAPTFGDLFADVLHQREARRGAGRAGARRRSASVDDARASTEAIRGGQQTVTVTRQEPARRARAPGSCTSTPSRLRALSRRRRREVGARAHGVLEAVPAVRRHRAAAPDAVSRVRRRAGADADRVADDQRAARPGRRRADPGARQGPRRAATAARPATSTSTSPCAPHPLFERDGDDLHVTVPVAVHEAALGAKIDVPSLDGPARLRVPPGTQSGQRFRRARARRAVAARRPPRRSRRRGQAGAAEAARRAVEGAAAGVRPDQREDVRQELNEHKGHEGH